MSRQAPIPPAGATLAARSGAETTDDHRRTETDGRPPGRLPLPFHRSGQSGSGGRRGLPGLERRRHPDPVLDRERHHRPSDPAPHPDGAGGHSPARGRQAGIKGRPGLLLHHPLRRLHPGARRDHPDRRGRLRHRGPDAGLAGRRPVVGHRPDRRPAWARLLPRLDSPAAMAHRLADLRDVPALWPDLRPAHHRPAQRLGHG